LSRLSDGAAATNAQTATRLSDDASRRFESRAPYRVITPSFRGKAAGLEPQMRSCASGNPEIGAFSPDNIEILGA